MTNFCYHAFKGFQFHQSLPLSFLVAKVNRDSQAHGFGYTAVNFSWNQNPDRQERGKMKDKVVVRLTTYHMGFTSFELIIINK